MADGFDGSVIIKTGLDLATIEKDAETLKKSIDAATRGAKELQSVATASGKAQIAMLQQANAGWREQLKILNKIRDAMGGATIAPASMPQTTTRTRTRTAAATEITGPTETAEYAELRKQAEALDKAMEKTIEKIDKMVALYGQAKVEGMKAFQSLQYDFSNQQERYARVVDRMQELEMDGQRYVDVQQESAEVTQEETQEVGKLAKAYTFLSSVMNTSITQVIHSTKSLHKHSALSLKNVMKYALGIRSVFFLVRRLRSVAKEALGVVAQYDPALNTVVSNLMTSVKQLKADFGAMLQPLVQVGAPILTFIVDKVSAVTRELAKFFAALAGQDYINVATVKAVDYADGLDKVADSANKASEALGGYDKLNVISQDNASGNDAANNMRLTKDTVQYTKEALDDDAPLVKLGKRIREIFDWAWQKLVEIKDWLLDQEWVQTIISNLQELLSDPDGFLVLIGATLVVSKLASLITSSVTSALTLGNLGKLAIVATVAIAGYKLGEKIFNSLDEGFQDELGKAVADLLDNPLESLAEGVVETFTAIGEFIYGVWDGIVEWLSNVFLNIFTPLENAWKSVKEWFSKQWKDANEETKQQWAKITGTITGTVAEIGPMFRDLWQGIKNTFASVGQWFGDKFTSAKNAIVGTFAEIGPMFRDLWQSIKNAFASVGSWFGSTFTGAWNNVKAAFASAGSFFAGVWSTIKEKFGNVKTWFKDKFKDGLDAIKGVFTGVGDWFFDNVYLKVKNAFLNLVPSLTEKFRDAWESIKAVFVGVGTFFGGIWETIKEKFTNIGQKVGEAFSGAFKKVINKVLETAERVLNAPISAINSLLGTINKIPGVDIGKLDKMSLPRLAQGAVIPPNKEFLAVLGDQRKGTNIEAPLDTIVAAMEKALGTTGAGAQSVNLYLGEKQIAKAVWDATQKQWKQTGSNPWGFSAT